MLYHDGHDDFDSLERHVDKTVEQLSEHLDRFDSIVVQGVSGMCVGFPVALRLGKPILVLRKENEVTHGYEGRLINRDEAGSRILFLDDLIDQGETLDRCRTAVACQALDARVVGEYTYQHHELTWSDEELLQDEGCEPER